MTIEEIFRDNGTRGTGNANVGRGTGGHEEKPPVDTTPI
jgi:hypothetical protein